MASRGRPTVEINLSTEERATLQRWARRHSSLQAWALRAKIVLDCAAEDATHAEIAAILPMISRSWIRVVVPDPWSRRSKGSHRTDEAESPHKVQRLQPTGSPRPPEYRQVSRWSETRESQAGMLGSRRREWRGARLGPR